MQFSTACKLIFALALVFCSNSSVWGQQKINAKAVNLTDTAVLIPAARKPFSDKPDHPDSTHSPMGALIKSATIPGWGQFYNKRWWKVPLIYGALGSFTTGIIYNYRNFKRDLRLYRYYYEPSKVTSTTPDYVYFEKLYKGGVSQQEVADAVDGFDRDFQLCILGFAGFWALQVLDAYIDAKFAHSFSIDNNLTLKISPGIMTQTAYAANYGRVTPVLRITLNL